VIESARRPPVVIIVDDDDLVTRALARVIRAGGLVPKVYKDPEHFLAEIEEQQGLACILLDITMPRITGLQVQAQLEARGIETPVIAVSARDDDETRRRARELDAKVFFRKPVDDQALLDAIAWVIQAQCGQPSAETGPEQAPDET
jgi:FixJ family two-component response regulator